MVIYLVVHVAHGFVAAVRTDELSLLETVEQGRTVVFDLMDGYFYNDPAAASEFWALKAKQSVPDINARIRRSIEQGRRLVA
jgi:hypothetical protein